MPAVTQRIGNLLGGISQQPDSVKLPGQLRDAVNVLPDPTYGLLKRPGLKLVKALSTAATGGRWFSIFRDATNKYIGQFAADGNLRIWNATTGVEQTVNTPTTAARNYIANVSRADFELLEINDYNFVLNRSKTVAKLPATSPTQAPRALVVISSIGYDQKFTVKLDATEYSYTTVTTGTLSLQDVVNGLKTAIDASAFNATAVGNCLVIARDNNADFGIDAYGATLNSSIDAYKGTVPDISRLPGYCTNGFVIQVKAPIGDGGDYWVKFVTDNAGNGAGVWEETIAPNIQTTLDPDTMPHVIIRNGDNTFTYRSLNQAAALEPDLYWMARDVGDDETNPFPTLTGKKITGMSFFRNRLVLMSGSNVICSQPGSYFNLFRNSAIVTSEADAIDISAGSVKPIDFKYALGDQQGLVLFSDRSQFLLTSGADAFSALTANITRITTENVDVTTSPVETGSSIIFLDNNQGYTKVTEMVVTSAENRPQTADLTRTVPNLIPSGNRGTVASSSAELVSISVDDPNDTLYVFKYFNRGNERVLASWVKWVMPSEVALQAIDRDTMYVVTKSEVPATITKIAHTSSANTDGSSIAWPGGHQAGQLGLLFVFGNDPTFPYITSATGWQLLGAVYGDVTGMCVFYKFAVSGSETAPVINGPAWHQATLVTYSGVDQITPFGTQIELNHYDGNNSTVVVPSITTASDNALVVWTATHNNADNDVTSFPLATHANLSGIAEVAENSNVLGAVDGGYTIQQGYLVNNSATGSGLISNIATDSPSANPENLIYVFSLNPSIVSRHNLSKINLLSDASGTAINDLGVPYEYRLDLFDNNPTTALSSGNTKVYFKAGVFDSTLTPVVVVNESPTQRGMAFIDPPAGTDGGGDFVTIAGDFTGADQITLGYAYPMEIDLPRFYRRQTFSDGTAQSDVVNIPRVHRLVMQSNNSGPFDATVALRGRPTRTFDFPQRPADVYTLDNPPTPEVIDNSIPIYGKGTDALVTISTESPFPISFVSMQWYGHYTNRGIGEV